MRTVILLTLLALARPAAADIVVTAKIVELPKTVGACGVMEIRAVIRYEVVKLEKGTLDDKQLHVIVSCPEFYKVGTQHRLHLGPPPASGTYIDTFGGTAPRYRATKIE
jgi:hypothetical protein